MAKQKHGKWESFQNIPMNRAEVFGLSVPVSQDECISRLLKMRHSRKDIAVHVGNRNADNTIPVHIQWGKHAPIHTECFLAVVPTNAREVRLVGKIGVIKGNTISHILTLFVIWAILAANVFRQNGFSVGVMVMLIAILGIMALTASILYTIPVATRPVMKRLDSILSFAFYGEEVVKRKIERLVIKETTPLPDAQVTEHIQTSKPPNQFPR
jgi:hypothetical protein